VSAPRLARPERFARYLRPADRADRDARPTIAGSRVQLAGELHDGPEGTCDRIDSGNLRWVLFDGERRPILVHLRDLRRLP
jgi:hypothetical protein